MQIPYEYHVHYHLKSNNVRYADLTYNNYELSMTSSFSKWEITERRCSLCTTCCCCCCCCWCLSEVHVFVSEVAGTNTYSICVVCMCVCITLCGSLPHSIIYLSFTSLTSWNSCFHWSAGNGTTVTKPHIVMRIFDNSLPHWKFSIYVNHMCNIRMLR